MPPAGGNVWRLTEESDVAFLREEAIQAACDCPTGRLVQHDKIAACEGLEPDFEPFLSLLQSPDREVGGPGGIPLVGADGVLYEIRNRYAPCRCGRSGTRPFATPGI